MLDLYEKLLIRMTSDKILKQSAFNKPFIISPEHFQSFEHLLEYFHEIRDLKLVPVKDDEMYQKYHQLDKSLILKDLYTSLENFEIFIQDNMFPYWLSKDVRQRIIWLRADVNQHKILEFITDIILSENLDINHCIFFERPNNVNVTLVKGTVPEIRHIHFWTKF